MLFLDSNFVTRYNNHPRRTIETPGTAIIASEWYRERLGISKHTDVDLDISSSDCAYGRMRACLDHPQVVVRLATKLAIWSVVLGVAGALLGALGILLGMISLCK